MVKRLFRVDGNLIRVNRGVVKKNDGENKISITQKRAFQNSHCYYLTIEPIVIDEIVRIIAARKYLHSRFFH